MTQFKKLFLLTALAAGMAAPAGAQEWAKTRQAFPHMFVGVQGGAQTTFTNYDNSKLITPTASVGFGAWFTPIIGARLHANGAWNKGGLKTTTTGGTLLDTKYDYNYITTDLDLMVNLVTLFGKKDYYPLNLYLIGGIGLNTAWNNGDARAFSAYMPMAWDGTRLSHNGRIGMQLDYNLMRNLSVNLEVAANSLSDRYNSKVVSKDDWQMTAQLGLAFKFGHKKVKAEPVAEVVEEVVPEEIWGTRIDTIWYDDVTYKEVTRERDIKKEIFFGLREYGVDKTQSQIKAVAEFLKGVTNGEITITSYADKGTGNPKLNMGYSKKRAESTRKALLEQGVDAKLIKSIEWKGDTVQPYAENDKNRLSVISGRGTYAEKEKVTERKFRTKEVRYRVQ